MTDHDHVVLGETERLTFGHADLIAHDVGERDHLSHWMLNLYARVHFHKIETLVFVQEKFESAGARIADRFARADGGLAHPLAQFRGHHRLRRFFQKLLMPTLDRALALAEIDALAVFIGHYLNFDVTRTLDIALNVNVAVLERGGCFSRSGFQRVSEFTFRVNDAHSATATAAGCFDDDGITDLVRELNPFLFGLNRAFAARKNRDASLFHRIPGRNFFAHQPDHLRAWSDEFDVAGLANLSEVSRLSQKPVAGMNRIDVENFRRADDGRNVQVALRRRRRANAGRLIGKPDMKRIAIDIAVHGDRANAHLFASPDDPAGNFSAISDQDFAKVTHDSVSGEK